MPYADPQKRRANARRYKKENREIIRAQAARYREKYRDRTNAYALQWASENREKRRLYSRRSYAKNRIVRSIENAEYRASNHRLLNEKKMERYRTIPIVRLRANMRSRIANAFRSCGWKKDASARLLLGADLDVVRSHIESKFKNGMNWGNRGAWQVDHIIPLASANTKEHLVRLFHYTNLQPLWEKENRSKGARMDTTS